MIKKRNKERTTYESPKVKEIKVKVERGFAVSYMDSDTGSKTEMTTNYFFVIGKTKDGGGAW